MKKTSQVPKDDRRSRPFGVPRINLNHLLTISEANVTIGAMFKPYAQAFFNLLSPKNCHICSRLLNSRNAAFDDHLCWDCFCSMKRTAPVSCRLCGLPLKSSRDLKENTCPVCRKNTPSYKRLLSCYVYGGAVRKLIHRFKYDHRPYLAETLSRLILKTLPENWLKDFDVFVPVPLHPVRQREREYNQAELILRLLARNSGKPLVPALIRKKNTRPLSELKKTERHCVLNGAFGLDEKQARLIRGKRVLLFDDIITSTSTAREISRLLCSTGCEVSVLSFARG